MANKITKKDLKKELEALQELILPIFQDFVGNDTDITPEIIVKKEKGYVHGKVCFSIPAGLVYAAVEKCYCIGCEDGITETYCGADTYLKIILRWFDWDDDLEYKNIYYPNMDNNTIVKKFKVIAEAAKNLVAINWETHTKGDADNG